MSDLIYLICCPDLVAGLPRCDKRLVWYSYIGGVREALVANIGRGKNVLFEITQRRKP
jgi:hypothetical protein